MKKEIGISVLSLLIGSLLFIGGATLFDDDAFYCEEKGIVMNCARFSDSGNRCYPSLTTTKGYKDCTEWIKIVNDDKPQPVPSGSYKCCGSTCWTQDKKCPKDCEEGGCR